MLAEGSGGVGSGREVRLCVKASEILGNKRKRQVAISEYVLLLGGADDRAKWALRTPGTDSARSSDQVEHMTESAALRAFQNDVKIWG